MTTLPLKGFKIEGGKVKPAKKKQSVSERIRERKSKRVRPIKKIGD